MKHEKSLNKTTIKAIKDARLCIDGEETTIDEIIAQKISDDVKNGKEKVYDAKDIFKEIGIRQ
jgi:hypothetical protein